jgi:hypothetical protein
LRREGPGTWVKQRDRSDLPDRAIAVAYGARLERVRARVTLQAPPDPSAVAAHGTPNLKLKSSTVAASVCAPALEAGVEAIGAAQAHVPCGRNVEPYHPKRDVAVEVPPA